jgi:hypothetical protein
MARRIVEPLIIAAIIGAMSVFVTVKVMQAEGTAQDREIARICSVQERVLVKIEFIQAELAQLKAQSMFDYNRKTQLWEPKR